MDLLNWINQFFHLLLAFNPIEVLPSIIGLDFHIDLVINSIESMFVSLSIMFESLSYVESHHSINFTYQNDFEYSVNDIVDRIILEVFLISIVSFRIYFTSMEYLYYQTSDADVIHTDHQKYI